MLISIECNSCDEEFEMALDETIIYIFDEPEFNHISTVCENCLTKTVLFFSEPQFLQLGYPIVHQPEVPYHVRHIWAQLNDPDNLPEPPQDSEPTPDEKLDEWEASQFHDWLETVNPEDFNV